MSVRCVLARDDVSDETLKHSEHVFAVVPAYADTVSVLLADTPQVFFVTTSVMHCAAGVIASEGGPVVHLAVSRRPPSFRT